MYIIQLKNCYSTLGRAFEGKLEIFLFYTEKSNSWNSSGKNYRPIYGNLLPANSYSAAKDLEQFHISGNAGAGSHVEYQLVNIN